MRRCAAEEPVREVVRYDDAAASNSNLCEQDSAIAQRAQVIINTRTRIQTVGDGQGLECGGE